MEHVVYLLGAGFSAPLGLPVMSNFRFKAEDMYLEDPEKYGYFQSVFDTMRNLSIGHNYFDMNLFNIEDVLSILEMEDFLRGKAFKKKFIDFIIEVIEKHTPAIEPADKELPGNWWDYPFHGMGNWVPYAIFTCSLLGRRFLSANPGRNLRAYDQMTCARQRDAKVRYSVVTLNYDRVLERVCDFINGNMMTELDKPVGFDLGLGGTTSEGPALAKLHGSTDTRFIIPPTWSKGRHSKIAPIWKLAFKVLSEATQIRIMGYSLPLADAYVKYLLKTACIPHPKLRQIDVICRDPDGSVKRRYDDFIKFGYYKFVDGDTMKYLSRIGISTDTQYGESIFNMLEEAHAEFMRTA